MVLCVTVATSLRAQELGKPLPCTVLQPSTQGGDSSTVCTTSELTAVKYVSKLSGW